jgi:SH3-like domain-containing protein
MRPFSLLRRTMGLLALCGLFAACLASQASAIPVETSAPKGRETGLPVPRFVSLKSANARMRIGPSLDYGTKWIYVKSGLPLEITAEYDNWRQVRDSDGITGWMHRALLSSRRTAVIGPWLKQPAALHTGARESAAVSAALMARVLVHVGRCDGAWCSIGLPHQNLTGFVEQSALWGVYPGETIAD